MKNQNLKSLNFDKLEMINLREYEKEKLRVLKEQK